MSSALPRRRPALAAGGLALAFLVAGCGDGRKPVYPVRGQVLDADGKPAAGAKVIFHPIGINDPGAARPVGVVDDSGEFTLTTYASGDGAPPGNYAVTVEWRPPRTTPFGAVPGDRLKGRYASAAKSPFQAMVGTEPTRLEPFRLN
jgi:hypothetical protein